MSFCGNLAGSRYAVRRFRSEVDVRATQATGGAAVAGRYRRSVYLRRHGEGILMSRAQRRQLAETVVSAVGGRVPVMVHVAR